MSSFSAAASPYDPSWRNPDPAPVPNVPNANQNPMGVSLYNRRTPASGNSSNNPTLIREPRAIRTPAIPAPAPRGGSRRRRNKKSQSRRRRQSHRRR